MDKYLDVMEIWINLFWVLFDKNVIFCMIEDILLIWVSCGLWDLSCSVMMFFGLIVVECN